MPFPNLTEQHSFTQLKNQVDKYFTFEYLPNEERNETIRFLSYFYFTNFSIITEPNFALGYNEFVFDVFVPSTGKRKRFSVKCLWDEPKQYIRIRTNKENKVYKNNSEFSKDLLMMLPKDASFDKNSFYFQHKDDILYSYLWFSYETPIKSDFISLYEPLDFKFERLSSLANSVNTFYIKWSCNFNGQPVYLEGVWSDGHFQMNNQFFAKPIGEIFFDKLTPEQKNHFHLIKNAYLDEKVLSNEFFFLSLVDFTKTEEFGVARLFNHKLRHDVNYFITNVGGHLIFKHTYPHSNLPF